MAININHPENLIEGLSSITLKSSSGQTITLNPASGTINVSSAKINNVSDPTNLQDAATKNYVDTKTAGLNLAIEADTGIIGSVNIETGILTINGTSYQIDTVVSGDTVTISLPTALVAPGSLTVTDDLTVQGNTTFTGTLSAGSTTLDSLTVSDLTSGRIPFAGTDGKLVDSNNLTWDGSTLAVTGDQTISGDLTVSTDLTVTGDATINGNLTVQGTTTTVNSTNTELADNVLVLNRGELGAGVSLQTSGIEVDRGTLDNASWKYSELTNSWEAREGANLTKITSSEIDAGNVNIQGNTISSSGPINIVPGSGSQVQINGAPVSTQGDAIAYAIVFGG